MQGEQIRERLHSGERVYGTQLAIEHDGRSAAVLAQLELDFVFFCGEHHPVVLSDLSMLCHYFQARNVSPLVRISHPSAVEAARVLDAGAQGILAPYVETVEQAQEVVGAVHYRPLKGRLLADLLTGRKTPNEKTLRYLGRFNRNGYVILGVESLPAYENLDRLLGVGGVDGIFVGPHDLSVSMGIAEEWDHPEYLRVIEDIIARCRAAGRGVGVHLFGHMFPQETIVRFLEKGMNLVIYSSNVILARDSLREGLDRIRREAGEGAITRGVPSAPGRGHSEVD